MKKIRNISLIILSLVMMANVNMFATGGFEIDSPTDPEGYFTAKVYCPMELLPIGGTMFLGWIPADGQEYQMGATEVANSQGSELEFVLYGQSNADFFIKTEMMTSVPTASPVIHIMSWRWYYIGYDINDGAAQTSYTPVEFTDLLGASGDAQDYHSGQINEKPYRLILNEDAPCDSYAYFKVEVLSVKAETYAQSGSQYVFPVRVTASVTY